ncbi:FkbM family methyltransferase [Thermodesulfobacteriota bacterium]
MSGNIVKQIIQSYFLKIYALFVSTGFLSKPWIRTVFYVLYDWYKLFIEAGDIRFLKNYVKPGGVVIDIGANVGFFTKRFAQWVSDGGFVIALEPEKSNLHQLKKNLDKSGAIDVVKIVKGVAAEHTGTLKLAVNPIHPGDHKIAEEGEEISSFTIDELVLRETATPVCLLKIDVQGAEERVLRGALDTIQRDHPAIFIELDDEALQKMGSSAGRVVNLLMDLDYRVKRFGKNPDSGQIKPEEVIKMCLNGRYKDVLFVYNPCIEL